MGNAPARLAYENYVAQKAKALGIGPKEAAAFQAGLGSNKVALNAITKVSRAVEAQEKTMLDNIKVAEKLAPDAQKSTIPFLNKWAQTGSTALGMKGAPAYAAAIITIADQYAKIISGATGAAGSTDAARKQANDLLSQYLNDGQIGAVYEVLKADSENKRKEYEGVQQDILFDIANPQAPAAPAPAPDTGKPVPTAADLAYIKAHPDKKAQFVAHFGREP
jgi:hypothetical protein